MHRKVQGGRTDSFCHAILQNAGCLRQKGRCFQVGCWSNRHPAQPMQAFATEPITTVCSGFKCLNTSPESTDSSTRQLPCSSTMSQVALPGSTTITSPGTSQREDMALQAQPQNCSCFIFDHSCRYSLRHSR